MVALVDARPRVSREDLESAYCIHIHTVVAIIIDTKAPPPVQGYGFYIELSSHLETSGQWNLSLFFSYCIYAHCMHILCMCMHTYMHTYMHTCIHDGGPGVGGAR